MPKISKLRLTGFFFLLISAVVGLMLVFIPDVFPDIKISYSLNIVGILLILSGLYLLPTLISLFKHIFFWLTEDGKRNGHIHLDFDTPLPKHMLRLVKEVENLGFTKMGTKAIMRDDKSLYRFWQWNDDTNTVIALLCEHNGNPFTSFMTKYEDGFSLETAYNFNLEVDKPNTLLHNFTSSIKEAYHFHLHQFDEQQAKHGQPRVLDTLASTDPIPDEHKQIMREIFSSQIVKFALVSIFYGTFVLAGTLFIMISPHNTLLALLSCFLTIGLPLSLIDYSSVLTSSVDERKARKVMDLQSQ